jgi:biotin carboxylase
MTTKHILFVTWKTGNAKTLEAAKRLGHRVTLIRSRRMERQQRIDFETSAYADFPDAIHVLEDATDLAALRECVRRIHAQHPVDGFMATVDALVVPVALIAEELGIAFTTAHGAATAKAKDACRDALAAAGLDRTAHAVFEPCDLDGALAFAGSAGYPVVAKPACGSASEGARVLRDAAQLREYFAGLDADDAILRDGVLIEQYLRGRFVSAEVGLSQGEFLRLAVSERSTWSRHEPLETGTTIPAAIGPEEYEAVMAFAEAAVRALDLRLGVFHVEIMLGEDGVPRLIELNPRVMGSCLPNLFELAGGGDLFELLVRIYLDEPVPQPAVAFTDFATVRWFGAAEAQPTPAEVPDTAWTSEYGGALRSLSIRLPEAAALEPCRGNLGNFGEVQVVHGDHATSIRMAEEIVARIEHELGFEVTR